MSDSTNPSPGYNQYSDQKDSDSETNRYTNEYEEMSEYVDSAGFRDSYSTGVGTHDSIMYPDEAVIQRHPSKKLLANNPAISNIICNDSEKRLARGDTVKKTPHLDTYDPSTANGSATLTKIEKFQSWMINEGKYIE